MEICVVNFSSYAQVLLWLKMNAISIFLEEKKIFQIINDWRSHGQNHVNSLVRKCGNPEIQMINPRNKTAMEVNCSRANFYQLVRAIM